MNKKVKNRSSKQYFLLTFLISWSLWSPFYFFEKINDLWLLPGAWGPTFAAIILSYLDNGKVGIRNLLKKVLIWKVPLKYYIFSVFALLLIGSSSILIHKLIGGDFPDLRLVLEGMGLTEEQLGLGILLLPLFFLINTLLGGPVAEELGWRGYAQEAMQQKYTPNITGLVIGFLWSIWHLPLIIYLPKAVGNMPIEAYIPLMTAMGVIFSWLYNKTQRSVLLAILLHGGMNFAHGFLGADIFSDKIILTIQVISIIILAIVLSINNQKAY